MHEAQPSIVLLLFKRNSGKSQPAPIEVIALAGGTGAPNQHRRLLDQQSIVLTRDEGS
jgi:hypothetical protein